MNCLEKGRERIKSGWRRVKEFNSQEPFNTYGYLFACMVASLVAFQLTHSQLLFNLLMPAYTILYIALYVRFAGRGYAKGRITKRAVLACLVITVAGVELASL